MLTNRKSLRQRLRAVGGWLVIATFAGWAIAVALYWRKKTRRITFKRNVEVTSNSESTPLVGDSEIQAPQDGIAATSQTTEHNAENHDETAKAASLSSRSLLAPSCSLPSPPSPSARVFSDTLGLQTSSQTKKVQQSSPEKNAAGKTNSSIAPWIAFHRVLGDDHAQCPDPPAAKLQQRSSKDTLPTVRNGAWKGPSCENIFVQGESTDAIVSAVLSIQRALAAGRCEATSASAANNSCDRMRARKFESDSEFQLFLQRVKQGRAQPLLRKLFLCQGDGCNVEQEIWFEDKENELAREDPLKQFCIIHVHHHKAAIVLSSEIGECEKLFESPVDAINARHISSRGYGYQADNPFFDTFVEASGPSTLKVFPKGNWTCAVCKFRYNLCTFMYCRNKRDGCVGQRACAAWRWRQEKNTNPAMFQVLQVAAGFAETWTSGGSKDRHRAVHSGARHSSWMTLEEVFRATEGSTTRICALCIGINDYDFASPLLNCENDATAMASSIRKCGDAEVVEVVGRSTATELWDKIEGFADLIKNLSKPPTVVIFMFAGHGMRHKGKDYLLASDFKIDVRDPFRRGGCLLLEEVITCVCAPTSDCTAKAFFLDTCRNVPNSPTLESCPLRATDVEGSIKLCLNCMLIFAAQAGLKAADGPSHEEDPFDNREGGSVAMSNSPFTQCFVQSIFHPGVPLLALIAEALFAFRVDSGSTGAEDASRASCLGMIMPGVVLNNDRTTPLSSSSLSSSSTGSNTTGSPNHKVSHNLNSSHSGSKTENENENTKQSLNIVRQSAGSEIRRIEHKLFDMDEAEGCGRFRRGCQMVREDVAQMLQSLDEDNNLGPLLRVDDVDLESCGQVGLDGCEGNQLPPHNFEISLDKTESALLDQQLAEYVSSLSHSLAEDDPALSDLSQAGTEDIFLSEDEEYTEETFIHVEREVASSTACMRLLEAYVATYVDAHVLDIWNATRELRDTQEKLVNEVRELVDAKLLLRGCVLDSAMKTMLQESILASATPEETKRIVVYAAQKMENELEFMDKINRMAAEGYFCLDAAIKTDSFVAIIRSNKLGTHLLRLALTKSQTARKTMSDLGFRLILFGVKRDFLALKPDRQVLYQACSSIVRFRRPDSASVVKPELELQCKENSQSMASDSCFSNASTSPGKLPRSPAECPNVSITAISIPGFRLVRRLGNGAQGSVWLATDSTGEKAAVKLCPAGQHLSEREAANLDKISHPNVVKFFKFVAATEDVGHSAIVMEFVDGQPLDLYLRANGGVLPREQVFRILEQLLLGLASLHAMQPPVLHRDVKPSNIMLCNDDRVVIVDLGLSKELTGAEATMTFQRDGALVGTPAYVSPEQAGGVDGLDERVDVWAVGVVMYELLSGTRPFESEDNFLQLLHKIQHARVEPIPNLPASLNKFLLKALAKDRAWRFPNAQSMLSTFTSVTSNLDSIPCELEAFGEEWAGSAEEAYAEAKRKGLFLRGINHLVGGRYTPLMNAIDKPEDMKLLLAARADVSVTNAEDFDCLRFAALRGNLPAVKILLWHSGTDLLFTESTPGENYGISLRGLETEKNLKGTGLTALHVACASGHSQVVSYLLEQGGSRLLNAKTHTGRTCLHSAAANGHPNIASLLLTLPMVDQTFVQIRDVGGLSAWGRDFAANITARTEQNEVAKLLEATGWVPSDDERSVVRAVLAARDRSLIARDVDGDNGADCTPLMAAIKRGAEEDVRLLLQARAQVSRVNAHGQSCFHLAVEHANTQVLEALLQHITSEKGGGQDERKEGHTRLLKTDRQGQTCFHAACALGRVEMVQRLAAVGGGSLLCATDCKGRTGLQLATENHQSAIVSLLSSAESEPRPQYALLPSPSPAQHDPSNERSQPAGAHDAA